MRPVIVKSILLIVVNTFLTLTAFAQDISIEQHGKNKRMMFEGVEFPAVVNLEEQFRPRTQIQEGGSCHVFSASAIFEAACFRKTGKKVDVSEAYLFYHHLRSNLSGLDSFPISELDKADGCFFGDEDGGFSLKTANRILDGNVCTEKEYPFNHEFTSSLIKIREVTDTVYKKMTKSLLPRYKNADNLAINAVESALPKSACTRMDQYSKCTLKSLAIPAIESKSEGVIAKTQDADLKKCTESGLQAHSLNNPSYYRMLKLLNDKIPFVCSDKMQFPNGQEGHHANVIMGYKFEPGKGFENDIRFKVRDSNYSKPITGANMHCDQILWID